MLWGAASGALELRATDGGVHVRGRFPYSRETELARGRFEAVAPRAFQWDGEALFLFQHEHAKPLASIRSGSLTLNQADEALEMEARIDGGTSWAADFLAAHRSGLITGLSPGFIVQPGGETVERRGDGVLRTIRAAQLVELSAVTRPAYGDAQLAARCWQAEPCARAQDHPLKRWRL